MRRFILKMIAYLILIMSINSAVETMMPYAWENSQYSDNLRYFESNWQSSTNTLFFGSSRTFTNVDPVAFDSLNSLNGIYTRSYVLASSAAFFNEQSYFLENFFKNNKSTLNLDYVFLELDDNISIDSENLYSGRSAHYINASNLFPILRQIVISRRPLNYKIRQCFYFITSMLRHKAYMGYARKRVKRLLDRRSKDKLLQMSNKGFRPLNVSSDAYQSSQRLQQVREELLRDTNYIHRNFDTFDSLFHQTPGDIYNPLVLKKYKDFISKMKMRGVHVICLLPMRRHVTLELISLYRAIPDDHKIDMKVKHESKSLKAVKYWFDRGHLNADGARIYTRLLADEFAIHMKKHIE